jgi:hypothetical protein
MQPRSSLDGFRAAPGTPSHQQQGQLAGGGYMAAGFGGSGGNEYGSMSLTSELLCRAGGCSRWLLVVVPCDASCLLVGQ